MRLATAFYFTLLGAIMALSSACRQLSISKASVLVIVSAGSSSIAARSERIDVMTARDARSFPLFPGAHGEPAHALPIEFVVEQQRGIATADITVRAMDGANPVAERRARVHFRANRMLLLHVHLSEVCVARSSPCKAAALTCGNCGTCEPIDVPSEALPVIDDLTTTLARTPVLECRPPGMDIAYVSYEVTAGSGVAATPSYRVQLDLPLPGAMRNSSAKYRAVIAARLGAP